jgi:hypothetical protein
MGSGSYSARSSFVNAAGAGTAVPAPLPSAQELQHTARQQLARYLQQARQQRALEMADAVDTLLACLLCEVGDAAALEQLVRQPRCLAARPALSLMQASGRWHALALYRWAGPAVPNMLHGYTQLPVPLHLRLATPRLGSMRGLLCAAECCVHKSLHIAAPGLLCFESV